MIKAWLLLAGAFFWMLFLPSDIIAGSVPPGNGLYGNASAGGHAGSSGKDSHSRQNRSAGRSQNHELPKPERNRLGETRGKKVRGGRKKGSSKKCKVSSSGSPKGSATQKKRNRQESESSLLSEKTIKKGEGDSKLPDGIKVRSERIDDVPLLIGMMEQMGLREAIDNHIPKHWKQRDLSWGWTAVIWLAYILSEGDHRKVSVREYIAGMTHTLSELTGRRIEELDFTDDRLGILLKKLNNKEYWEKIEDDLNKRTIKVYELPTEVVRNDATTVSGCHETEENGLFQFGHSKDDPSRPQIKLMTSALDPLGMPLVTEVVSGEKADDGLYIPVIERVSNALNKKGLLYVGDCKQSGFEIRLYIKGREGHYLSPLPRTGKTSQDMETWIEQGISKETAGELIEVHAGNDKDEDVLISKGYEFERHQSGAMEGQEIEWTERVLVAHSPAHASRQEKGLEKRLKTAGEKLNALTPPRGPGKRQFTDENELKSAIDKILKHHKVEGLLRCEYEKEVEKQEKYIGRGRGSGDRPKKVIEKVRYQMLKVIRNEKEIESEKKKFGWKVFVTDVPRERLSFGDIIKCYRKEYRVERIFHRLKSRMDISPVFLKRDEQVSGLTHLLMLGVRVLTLMEFVVRRSLKNDNGKLGGLHPENPKKETDRPTTERLLKAFSKMTLTIINTGGQVIHHLPPLSELQKEILRRLRLDFSIYQNLGISRSSPRLNE